MMSIFFTFNLSLFNNCIKLYRYYFSLSWNMSRGKEVNLISTRKPTFKKPHLIRVKRCFSLIKVLSWFPADLKILLTLWLKFTLSRIYILESLKFDAALIFPLSMPIIWLVHLHLLKIIAWNLPGITILPLSLTILLLLHFLILKY